MSRTRNKYNNAIYYFFKTHIVETDNTNEIENETNEIGVAFTCKVLGVVKGYRDAMTGVWQSTTVKTIKTMVDLDFAFGDILSAVKNPTDTDKEFIQKALPVEQSNRGGKHNSKPIIEWHIEVS